MKQIDSPVLYIRLRHGGTLQLSLCTEDKIAFLRCVLLSLELDPVAKTRAQKMISAIEDASRKGGVWANIARLVKAQNCVVCMTETNFGGKRGFSLCAEHNNWRTYIKLRRGK